MNKVGRVKGWTATDTILENWADKWIREHEHTIDPFSSNVGKAQTQVSQIEMKPQLNEYACNAFSTFDSCNFDGFSEELSTNDDEPTFLQYDYSNEMFYCTQWSI
jgi:hypothetical protein